jgi:hypothetical protein
MWHAIHLRKALGQIFNMERAGYINWNLPPVPGMEFWFFLGNYAPSLMIKYLPQAFIEHFSGPSSSKLYTMWHTRARASQNNGPSASDLGGPSFCEHPRPLQGPHTIKTHLIWNCARRLCLVRCAWLSKTKLLLGKEPANKNGKLGRLFNIP